MKLVIDIPNHVKNRLIFGATYKDDLRIMVEALANGTPLEAQPTDKVKCNYTTEEIAKSFIEDVEAVKDQLDGQPCEDTVSREEVLSLQTEYAEKMGATTFWKLRDDIRGLPPVTPRTNLAETSRDCISIEPIQWYSQNKDGYLVKGAYSKDEAYVKLTDVYEKIRTSEDCIRREDVIDLTWDWENFKNITRCDGLDTLRQMRIKVEELPSVTPERPKGKWIGKYISGATDYEVLIKQWQIAKCNKCGKEYKTPYTDCKFVDYAYCPNCGAEMSGGEE